MGSSKKSKDKDRERRKRKRERSSSRTRDQRDKHHHRHHHKHKKHKRSREERSLSISLSDLSDIDIDFDAKKYGEAAKHPSAHRGPIPPPPLIQQEPSRGKEVSLSIEATNKIRAKLGLKPLQETTVVLDASCENVYKPGQEIHKPPENLRDKIQVDKLREKIAAQREKRRLKEKLTRLKTLGDDDEEEEDVAEWVLRSKQKEADRKEAEKRNKIMEELDAQFGVGDLVEEDARSANRTKYGQKQLAGLKVHHHTDRFEEGRSTILTLKDSAILEADEDTLVNVNLEDDERAEKNAMRRREKTEDDDGSDALEGPPLVDEDGRLVAPRKEMLKKYDEEIAGADLTKKSFRIGQEAPRETEETRRLKATTKLRELTSLSVAPTQLATEYLTKDESIVFRKVKKKKKKNKALTADDLEPLEEAEVHWGSRGGRRPAAAEEMGQPHPAAAAATGRAERIKCLRELMMEEEPEPARARDDDDDDADEGGRDSENERDAIELQEALARSRRAKLESRRRAAAAPERVSDALEANEAAAAEALSEDGDAITLNLTDEFCRSLGDIPTYGLSGNRVGEEPLAAGAGAGASPPRGSETSFENQEGAWAEVDIDNTRVEIASGDRGAPILEEEPDTTSGVANALRLAAKKGYLQKEDDKRNANATLQHLKAIHYSIEDKAVEDDRRGGRGGGGDRYVGPSMDFREKDLYKPEVKLEYVDDEGRKLCAKEAFRYLSHKFHGKGSGKNKLEKRMKKWNEELLMKHMSSSDTPLQTLERQRDKQKQLGAAYLVLSGNKTQEPAQLDVKK